jgi:probable addiction module antidote protein
MPTKDYKNDLYKKLINKKYAAGYLSACYEDSTQSFLIALRDVVSANGGLGKLAESTALNRESLYKLLSDNGNPKLSSLETILDAVGIKLEFAPKRKSKKAA